MKKLTERQRQAIATKLKISEIATDLFKVNGFDSTKIQDICNAANISIGAFYHHFKSKTEIINTVYEQIDLLVKERYESKTFISNVNKLTYIINELGILLENLGSVFIGEVYKNIISLKNKRSFKNERFIYLEIQSAIALGIENNEFSSDISANEFSDTIIRICRGAIFDWCLNDGEYILKDKLIFDLNLILSKYKN